ncbi:MAG: biotin--[acetyl-CoA-carboxylase] ligase [Desulfamplus sp.]
MPYDSWKTETTVALKDNISTFSQLSIKNSVYSIHLFDTVSSTMDKAKELAHNNAGHFSVVVAKNQTKGRGRLNRTWVSERGGLWFTIILRPKLLPQFAFQVNFAASLALAKTLKQKYGLGVSVKWPNDILFRDKKLAGLLSEMATDGDGISFVNIGIGINVNNNPEIDQPNAVSIKNCLSRDLGVKICEMDLLYSFLDCFENHLNQINIKSIREQSALQPDDTHQYLQAGFKSLMDNWKQLTSTIGRNVRIETFGDVYEGVAVDVDEKGGLIIRDKEGNTKRVIYGDCFYQETKF